MVDTLFFHICNFFVEMENMQSLCNIIKFAAFCKKIRTLFHHFYRNIKSSTYKEVLHLKWRKLVFQKGSIIFILTYFEDAYGTTANFFDLGFAFDNFTSRLVRI